jgi:hypothetical protein
MERDTSSNPFAHEPDTILSQRTHHGLKEQSINIKNFLRKTSCEILEMSRVNIQLDKLNFKISKLEFKPSLKSGKSDSLNKILDRMLKGSEFDSKYK